MQGPTRHSKDLVGQGRRGYLLPVWPPGPPGGMGLLLALLGLDEGLSRGLAEPEGVSRGWA